MKKLLLASLLSTLYALLPSTSLAGERYSVGFNSEFYSGYQWRNQISNSQAAFHGCLWGDLTVWESLYIGGYLWQNYDLTDNRRWKFRNALTETDYGIHFGGKAWDNESETFPVSLSLEAGHEWYVYNARTRSHYIHPCTDELYLHATLANPIATVYGQVSWMYRDFGCCKSGVHYEVGLNKEVSLPQFESVKVGADLNVGFANKDYHYYLLGSDSSGITGTTIKLYSKYALNDWATIKATIAYTGIVNGDARQEMQSWHNYEHELLWGCLALNLAF